MPGKVTDKMANVIVFSFMIYILNNLFIGQFKI
jgi:hypothetical protein